MTPLFIKLCRTAFRNCRRIQGGRSHNPVQSFGPFLRMMHCSICHLAAQDKYMAGSCIDSFCHRLPSEFPPD